MSGRNPPSYCTLTLILVVTKQRGKVRRLLTTVLIAISEFHATLLPDYDDDIDYDDDFFFCSLFPVVCSAKLERDWPLRCKVVFTGWQPIR